MFFHVLLLINDYKKFPMNWNYIFFYQDNNIFNAWVKMDEEVSIKE